MSARIHSPRRAAIRFYCWRERLRRPDVTEAELAKESGVSVVTLRLITPGRGPRAGSGRGVQVAGVAVDAMFRSPHNYQLLRRDELAIEGRA